MLVERWARGLAREHSFERGVVALDARHRIDELPDRRLPRSATALITASRTAAGGGDHVGDGDSALFQIRRDTHDVVILDLMLPGTNGFEVIRELKNRAPLLLSRTIVLTAMAEFALRDFDGARLVRRLMRKPFDLEKLIGEVLACAAPRESERPA